MPNQDLDPVDFSPYLRSPVFSVEEGISMARALIARCPKGAPPVVKRASAKLKKVADAAQSALGVRQREANYLSEEDSKALDQEMDGAWRGMYLRLEGYANLPHDSVPRARRAAELLTELRGSDGMSFLKGSYSAQLATMQTILQRIAEDKRAKDLDALCGPEFLKHIQTLMPRYERMVHAMLSRKTGSSENLMTHRHALSRAVLAYATAICAMVDEEDRETVDEALTALAPLAGQRAAVAGRRGSTPEAPETSPAPAPAPAAPPA